MTEADRASRILVMVDASNFEYTCVFSAVDKWRKAHFEEYERTVAPTAWETDQDDLPELLNIDSFRRTLRFAVQDRLELIRSVVSTNHMEDVERATAVDTFFALDGDLSKNFRKRLYPDYKGQREKERKKFNVKTAKAYVQDVLFKELGLESALGYKMVRVDGCESDDIIATLATRYPGYMAKILFSSDGDFLQLDGVSQYNCWGKRIERKPFDEGGEPMSAKDYLLWKVLKGDCSDNIRNVFHRVGEKKSWMLVNDKPTLKRMLKEDNGAAERFMLNATLIDFRRIPQDCIERITKAIDAKMDEVQRETDFSLDNCLVTSTTQRLKTVEIEGR